MKKFITGKLLAILGNVTGIGVIEWLSSVDFNTFFKLISQAVVAIVAILHFIKMAKGKSLNDKSGMSIVTLLLLSLLTFNSSAQAVKNNGYIYMEGISIDSSYIANHDSLSFRMVFANNTADTLILSYAKIPIAFNSGSMTDSVNLKFKYKNGSAYRLPSIQKNNVSTGISQTNGVLQITIPAVTAASGLKVAPSDTVSLGIYSISGITRAHINLEFAWAFIPNYFPLPQGKYYQLSSSPPPLKTMTYQNFVQNCAQGKIEWSYCSPGFNLILNDCQGCP